MTGLDDAARRFKEARFTKAAPTDADPLSDKALEAQIAARLSESLSNPEQDSTSEQDQRQSKPQEAPAVSEAPMPDDRTDSEWVIPDPVARALGGRARVPVDIPIRFESLRLKAKGIGMPSGHLVLAAMQTYQHSLVERAKAGEYHKVDRGFVKQWQLMLHETELAALDQLVDEVSEHMPRRSRALVTTLLLQHCRSEQAESV